LLKVAGLLNFCMLGLSTN